MTESRDFTPEEREGWSRFISEFFVVYKPRKQSACMHDACVSCGGTGIRNDGLGACIHGMACPCPKCSPR